MSRYLNVSGERKRGAEALCVDGKHQGKRQNRAGFPALSFPAGGIDMVITTLTAQGRGALDTLAIHLPTEGEGHGSYFTE